MGVFASHARTEIIGLQHESGTLFELVRSAEMFVISNTRSRVDTSGPGASDVYPEIPTKALHEALMNAYAHRDWEYGGAVMVELFNDAVEIISPGWFIEGQDPEAHLSGKDASSVSRNKLLTQTLYKSGRHRVAGNRHQAHQWTSAMRRASMWNTSRFPAGQSSSFTGMTPSGKVW